MYYKEVMERGNHLLKQLIVQQNAWIAGGLMFAVILPRSVMPNLLYKSCKVLYPVSTRLLDP